MDAIGRSERVARRRSMGVLAASVVAVVLLASGCIVNGTWTAAPPPVQPVQSLGSPLVDVSCVSEDWCLGVGWVGLYPLAQVWDGADWSVITAPSLAGARDTHMVSVECGTPTSCVAKVTRLLSSPDLIDYVVVWDGEQWEDLSGAEGPYVDPFPYSCASDGTCLIVDNRGEQTMVWDGDSVTRIPFSTTRPPWDVAAIDCLTGSSCVAATSFALAVWDGSTWSEVPGSGTPSIFYDSPHTLACSAVDRCLGVGPDESQTAPTSATWDGTGWTEAPLPTGVTSTRTLECAGASECLLRVLSGATPGMLAWNGSSWYQAPGGPVGLVGLSCLPQWCLGVGADGPPIAATYEWTNG